MSLAAEAVPREDGPLYNAEKRSFDGGRLKWEMVRRNLSPEELANRTGLGISTVKEARRGVSIREASARKILRELDRITPMSVGSI